MNDTFSVILETKLEQLQPELFPIYGEKAVAEKIFRGFVEPCLRTLLGYNENDTIESLSEPLCGKIKELIKRGLWNEAEQELKRNVKNSKDFFEFHTLWRLLYNALDFEDTLKTLPRYRQHFIHSFHVFFLGYLFLLSDKKIQEGFNKSLDLNKIFKAWFLASIYHDVSYPVSVAEDWVDEFFGRMFRKNGQANSGQKETVYVHHEISHIFGVEEYQTAFRKIAALIKEQESLNDAQHSLTERLMFNYLIQTSIVKSGKRDHGILSAIMLYHAYDYQGHSVEENLTKLAVDAILWHHQFWQKYTSITGREHMIIAKNPLRHLLAFCDIAQEWFRQDILNTIPNPSYKIELPSKRVSLKYVFDDLDKFRKFEAKWKEEIAPKLNFQKEVFSPEELKLFYYLILQYKGPSSGEAAVDLIFKL